MGVVPGHEVQRPSVGRVVHFVADHNKRDMGVRQGDCVAADITRLQLSGGPKDHAVDLFVKGSRGHWHELGVKRDDTGAQLRSWHFPERA